MQEAAIRPLETPRLLLTVPTPEMASRMVRYVDQNRAHLERWEPRRSVDFYTEAFWQREFASAQEECRQDVSLRLVLLSREQTASNSPILGQCNFRNIVRGAFHACHLGYSLDQAAEGKGLMYEALSAAIPHVFQTLGMHRVMANYIPTNARSGRLLRRLGFTVEGYARDYLYIAGAWQDHILTALTNPAWMPPEDRVAP